MFIKKPEPREEEIILDTLLETLNWNDIFIRHNLSREFLDKYSYKFDYKINDHTWHTNVMFNKIIDIYVERFLSTVKEQNISTIIDEFDNKFVIIREYFKNGVCYLEKNVIFNPKDIIENEDGIWLISDSSLMKSIKNNNIKLLSQNAIEEAIKSKGNINLKWDIKDGTLKIMRLPGHRFGILWDYLYYFIHWDILPEDEKHYLNDTILPLIYKDLNDIEKYIEPFRK